MAEHFPGAILGIPSKLLAPARLSAGMYKICTQLSTGFVENAPSGFPAMARRSLSGAVFRDVVAVP
jgi:hypothetical protein